MIVLIMLSHGQCVQVKSCKQIKGLPSTKCATFLPVHTAPSSYSNASLYKNSAIKFIWLKLSLRPWLSAHKE